MLVVVQRKGKWDGRRYIFTEGTRKIYHGPVAMALGGGGGGTTQEFTPTGPWSQQAPYVTGLFSEAARMYNQGAPQYFPGSTVADTNPNLAASQGQIQNVTGQNTGTIQGAMNQAAQNQTAGTMAGQVGSAQITPYNQAIQGLLGNAQGNPTQSLGQSALPAFYGGLGQASQAAQQVQTPQTQFGQMNAAPALGSALYSNGMNPYTGQIIDAALRSQNQQFSQNVLPQISSAANMAGQIGGTRQGIAEGMAAQQHQNMQKDLVAQMMGQAFQTGSAERMQALGMVGQGQQFNAGQSLAAQQLAEQQRQATMQSGLGQSQLVGNLIGQGQGLGQQALGQAGNLAGNMITTGSGQNLQSQVQNAALIPGLSQAMNQSMGLGNQIGLQQQSQDQAQRDAAVERWFYEQYAPYNMLTQYQNWVTGPYGSSADPLGGYSTAGGSSRVNYQPQIGPTSPYAQQQPSPTAPPLSVVNPNPYGGIANNYGNYYGGSPFLFGWGG